MSTYLVFWGIGEFGFVAHPEDNRVRVACLPGMAPYVDFGLDFGRKALAYCEDYYDIPYPLSKLDLIAVPDFAFGAMENWGAITFRENLLLFYPGITSGAGAERIAEVISHEIVHQWFGNLVTPSDWQFLWLNESFATYFGFGVVDHYHPDWETWPQFLYSQTLPALVRDAFRETIPIEIPGGEHVVINTSTAPIIYCKGGSILRQIKGYIGEENFQKGVRFYLEKYRYDCAASEDLWAAFETVSAEPVMEIMQSWLGQPGYPMVAARRRGNTLTFTQKRFSYLQNDASQTWRIPLSILAQEENGKWRSYQVLMDGPDFSLELDSSPRVYKINAGQTGFYRVTYLDDENLGCLGHEIRAKKLSPEDRWGIESDLFARVFADAVSPEDYLDFLENYENETGFLPLMSIAANLRNLYFLSGESGRKKIKAIGIRLTENLFSEIGYDAHPDDAHTTGTLRDQYIWLGVLLGSRRILEFAEDQFQKFLQNDPVHPDIAKSILQSAAYNGNAAVFDWMIQRYENAESEHDRTNVLSALGCFRIPEILSKVRAFTLVHVPPRNQSIPVAAMAENPTAVERLWEWYTTEKAVFAEFHPLIHERVFASIVPVCKDLKADAVRRFLSENQIKINPDVVSLTLERLSLNLRLRQKMNA
jgi:tricorn protease interacting factor F2/3